MSLQRLEMAQVVPITVEEAWRFFSNPAKLAAITPPWLGFKVTSPLPERMYPGLIVSYTVRPFLGIPVRWVTEITHVVEGRLFVDEQRMGPYRFWHHQHHFREVEGGVEVRDIVSYALPLGPVGGLLAPWLVAPRVREIFRYRRKALIERFGGGQWPVAVEGEPQPAA